MERDPVIVNAEISEVVFNTSVADTARFRDLVCVPFELSNFRSENGLKLAHAAPAERMNGFNQHGRVLVNLLRNFALCDVRVSDACNLLAATQII